MRAAAQWQATDHIKLFSYYYCYSLAILSGCRYENFQLQCLLYSCYRANIRLSNSFLFFSKHHVYLDNDTYLLTNAMCIKHLVINYRLRFDEQISNKTVLNQILSSAVRFDQKSQNSKPFAAFTKYYGVTV
ncbi:hypothetical protein Tsp_10768 [Trichinella spiralis]|uniref:hypothetical protein n=1 Tax=Trichinella spiralis TaxID=6334 RepID=UPI0001EFD4E3|nr:hypothetical protein Tsp_10768 [Trichinella spiralis]